MAPAAAADPLGILAEIELDPKKGGLIEQLQHALGGKSSRICLVFRLMDTDNSGAVSKEDFSSVMLQHMQLRCVDKQTIDLLFDLWDTDSSGQLTLQQLEDQLNGTADESAHFQHQLTKYDVGKGQVEGGGVVTALYWTATIIFAVCVFAVTQVIGAFGKLSSLLTVKTLTGMTTDVYPRENCIAPAIVLIVWTTNTKK